MTQSDGEKLEILVQKIDRLTLSAFALEFKRVYTDLGPLADPADKEFAQRISSLSSPQGELTDEGIAYVKEMIADRYRGNYQAYAAGMKEELIKRNTK